MNCTALYSNKYIDRSHDLPAAPKQIPQVLLSEFTMDGRVKIKPSYYNERFIGSKRSWTTEEVAKLMKQAEQGKLKGYSYVDTNSIIDLLRRYKVVNGARVLVIGSLTPWLEACILLCGAREVVTLEYSEIKSEHPQLKTFTPNAFRKAYLRGQLGIFDAVVTFSSVEHSGLGRFGDALNPWGDIIAIARGWCVTKPGGFLLIGVPYVQMNDDRILFNAAWGYGRLRYPYLATNWEQIAKGSNKTDQQVFLFRKLG